MRPNSSEDKSRVGDNHTEGTANPGGIDEPCGPPNRLGMGAGYVQHVPQEAHTDAEIHRPFAMEHGLPLHTRNLAWYYLGREARAASRTIPSDIVGLILSFCSLSSLYHLTMTSSGLRRMAMRLISRRVPETRTYGPGCGLIDDDADYEFWFLTFPHPFATLGTFFDFMSGAPPQAVFCGRTILEWRLDVQRYGRWELSDPRRFYFTTDLVLPPPIWSDLLRAGHEIQRGTPDTEVASPLVLHTVPPPLSGVCDILRFRYPNPHPFWRWRGRRRRTVQRHKRRTALAVGAAGTGRQDKGQGPGFFTLVRRNWAPFFWAVVLGLVCGSVLGHFTTDMTAAGRALQQRRRRTRGHIYITTMNGEIVFAADAAAKPGDRRCIKRVMDFFGMEVADNRLGYILANLSQRGWLVDESRYEAWYAHPQGETRGVYIYACGPHWHALLLTPSFVEAYAFSDFHGRDVPYVSITGLPQALGHPGLDGHIFGKKGMKDPCAGRPASWSTVVFFDVNDVLQSAAPGTEMDGNRVLNFYHIPTRKVVPKSLVDVTGLWSARSDRPFLQVVKHRVNTFLPNLGAGEPFQIVVASDAQKDHKLFVLAYEPPPPPKPPKVDKGKGPDLESDLDGSSSVPSDAPPGSTDSSWLKGWQDAYDLFGDFCETPGAGPSNAPTPALSQPKAGSDKTAPTNKHSPKAEAKAAPKTKGKQKAPAASDPKTDPSAPSSTDLGPPKQSKPAANAPMNSDVEEVIIDPDGEPTCEVRPACGPAHGQFGWDEDSELNCPASMIPEGYVLIDSNVKCALWVWRMMKERAHEARGSPLVPWQIDFTRLVMGGFGAMGLGIGVLYVTFHPLFSLGFGALVMAVGLIPMRIVFNYIARFCAILLTCLFRPSIEPWSSMDFFTMCIGDPKLTLPILSLTGVCPSTILWRRKNTTRHGEVEEVVSISVSPPPGIILDDSFLLIDTVASRGRNPDSEMEGRTAHCGLIVPQTSVLVRDPVCDPTELYSNQNPASNFYGPIPSHDRRQNYLRFCPGAMVDPAKPIGSVIFGWGAYLVLLRFAYFMIARSWNYHPGPFDVGTNGVVSFSYGETEVHPRQCRSGARVGFGHHHPSFLYDTLHTCCCKTESDGCFHLSEPRVYGRNPISLGAGRVKDVRMMPPADVECPAQATANLAFFQAQSKKVAAPHETDLVAMHQYRMYRARYIERRANLWGLTYAVFPIGAPAHPLERILGIEELRGKETRRCDECGAFGANRKGLCPLHQRVTHCHCGQRLEPGVGCACRMPRMAKAWNANQDTAAKTIISNYRSCVRTVARNSITWLRGLVLPTVAGYGTKPDDTPLCDNVKVEFADVPKRVKLPQGAKLLGMAVDPCLPVVLYMNLRGCVASLISRVCPRPPSAPRRDFLQARFRTYVHVLTKMAPKNRQHLADPGTKAWVNEVLRPACRDAGMDAKKTRKYVQAGLELTQTMFVSKKDMTTKGMPKLEKRAGFSDLFPLGPSPAPEPDPSPRTPPTTNPLSAKLDQLTLMAANTAPIYEMDPINYIWCTRLIQFFSTAKVGAIMLGVSHSCMHWLKKAFSLSTMWMGTVGAFFYAGGMDAVDTGDALYQWSNDPGSYLCEADFSKYDSYQTGILLSTEMLTRKIIHAGLWKHPLCRQVLDHMKRGFKTVAPGLFSVEGQARRLSGDPFTSYANSKNNADFNSFANFQLWCETSGDANRDITPENIRAAHASNGFGVVFNGDDHILKCRDPTIFPRIADLLLELGAVVKHKKPVTADQLPCVGFLGGFVVRAEVEERSGRRPCHVVVPDLGRFLTSLPWKHSAIDDTDWRIGVARGWQPILGTMPVYRTFVGSLASAEELATHKATDDRARDPDIMHKKHKMLHGKHVHATNETWEDLAIRFTSGDVARLRSQVSQLERDMSNHVPGTPAVMRTDYLDEWLGTSRGL